MDFLIKVLIVVGGLLVLVSLVDAARRLRWGSVFSGGVSDVYEVMRLQELNQRIREHVTETVSNGQNCFRIFNILRSTQFRNEGDPSMFARSDGTWRRTREQALKAAKKGFGDSERFLKISTDPAILLLREAFRFSVQTCVNCPIISGSREELKACPITETLKSEGGSQ